MTSKDARMSPPLRASLSALLADTGTSNRKAAQGAGIDPSAVTRYLNGEADPRVATLEGIAHACGAAVVIRRRDDPLALAAEASPQAAEVLRSLARALPRIRSDDDWALVRAAVRMVNEAAERQDRASTQQGLRRA